MNTKTTPIRGKVARILNAREVALNIGSREGVEAGMVFEVLDPKGENITDPDTFEILGSIRRPKIQIRTTQVEERVSLASTFRATKVNVGGPGGGFLLPGNIEKLFLPPRWVTHYETLKASEGQLEPLTEEESVVKVGDPVVQVAEEPEPADGAETETQTVE